MDRRHLYSFLCFTQGQYLGKGQSAIPTSKELLSSQQIIMLKICAVWENHSSNFLQINTGSFCKILTTMPRGTNGKTILPYPQAFRAKSALGHKLVLPLVVTSDSCQSFRVQIIRMQLFCLQLSSQTTTVRPTR